MSPQPSRATTAGQVYNDLRNLARRQGRAIDELFQLYLLERFLYRLAHGPLRNRFVLKGGTLLAAYALRRPTQDVDVQALDLATDGATVEELIGQICQFAATDGLVFGIDDIVSEPIRQVPPTKACGCASRCR